MEEQFRVNLEAVRERIARAAERSGRYAADVTLIGVTKTLPPEQIQSAIEDGITHIGENRVQEAESKFSYPRVDHQSEQVGRENVTLHLIGALQRNKAKKAAALFDCVQSVDRIELAEALNRAVGTSLKNRILPVLLEVNCSNEAGKSGVEPKTLGDLAEAVASCKHLRGTGLMTVARMAAGERELRETFARLRELLVNLQGGYPGDWRHLSMGMSDDYVFAIEEGATMVRLGRALFGTRAT